MIKKNYFLIFFLINLFNNSIAAVKNEIIKNFKKINNISFDFKQNIDDKNRRRSMHNSVSKKNTL